MSDLTVRLLTPADEPAYQALLRQGLEQHADCFRISPEDDLEPPPLGDTPERFTLGAFSPSGRLVGIVSFARDTRVKMRHKGLLFRMYVATEASGQGLGRRLISETIARVRGGRGLEQITLSVVASNQNAQHLYASLEFVSFARERRALKTGGKYLDEEQMALELHSGTEPDGFTS